MTDTEKPVKSQCPTRKREKLPNRHRGLPGLNSFRDLSTSVKQNPTLALHLALIALAVF